MATRKFVAAKGIRVLVLSLVVSFSIKAAAAGGCPPPAIRGMEDYDTAPCYLYERFPTQFVTAEQMCRESGGQLASISDEFVNTFVAQEGVEAFEVMSVENFWIGGHNLRNQSSWEWVDGALWKYTNWDLDEPSNITPDRCLAVQIEDGTWRAEDCFNLKPYVCALEIENYNTTTTPSLQNETTLLLISTSSQSPVPYNSSVSSSFSTFTSSTVELSTTSALEQTTTQPKFTTVRTSTQSSENSTTNPPTTPDQELSSSFVSSTAELSSSSPTDTSLEPSSTPTEELQTTFEPSTQTSVGPSGSTEIPIYSSSQHDASTEIPTLFPWTFEPQEISSFGPSTQEVTSEQTDAQTFSLSPLVSTESSTFSSSKIPESSSLTSTTGKVTKFDPEETTAIPSTAPSTAKTELSSSAQTWESTHSELSTEKPLTQPAEVETTPLEKTTIEVDSSSAVTPTEQQSEAPTDEPSTKSSSSVTEGPTSLLSSSAESRSTMAIATTPTEEPTETTNVVVSDLPTFRPLVFSSSSQSLQSSSAQPTTQETTEFGQSTSTAELSTPTEQGQFSTWATTIEATQETTVIEPELTSLTEAATTQEPTTLTLSSEPSTLVPSPKVEWQQPCLKLWTYDKDTNLCYLVMPSGGWEHDRHSCVQMHSQLVTIHSRFQNSFVKLLADKSKSVLDRVDVSIGLKEEIVNGTRVWKWLDDSAVDYSNWSKEYPKEAKESDGLRCGTMLTSGRDQRANGQWKHVDCESIQVLAVCSQPPNFELADGVQLVMGKMREQGLEAKHRLRKSSVFRLRANRNRKPMV